MADHDVNGEKIRRLRQRIKLSLCARRSTLSLCIMNLLLTIWVTGYVWQWPRNIIITYTGNYCLIMLIIGAIRKVCNDHAEIREFNWLQSRGQDIPRCHDSFKENVTTINLSCDLGPDVLTIRMQIARVYMMTETMTFLSTVHARNKRSTMYSCASPCSCWIRAELRRRVYICLLTDADCSLVIRENLCPRAAHI
jgi:hypothetical protein